jgi:hypothetical protein
MNSARFTMMRVEGQVQPLRRQATGLAGHCEDELGVAAETAIRIADAARCVTNLWFDGIPCGNS